jgi:hypothetical protein
VQDEDAAIYAQTIGIEIVSMVMTITGSYQGLHLGGGAAVETSNMPILPLALCLVKRNRWTVVALESKPASGEKHYYTTVTLQPHHRSIISDTATCHCLMSLLYSMPMGLIVY